MRSLPASLVLSLSASLLLAACGGSGDPEGATDEEAGPNHAGAASESSSAVAPIEYQIEGTSGPIVLDRYDGPGSSGVVVLFHQGGGSARGEYAFLVPRLLELGFDVVTPDLPGGGDRFGEANRTLARTPEAEGFGYCDALPDVTAVLRDAAAWKPDQPLIAWGSSYSGALVLHAAVQSGSPEIARVLAFSPASGEPMAGCAADDVADRLTLPVLVVRPESEAAIPTVQAQLERFAIAGHQTLVAVPGAHGSSTLNAERVEGDVEHVWEVVRGFLMER